MSSITTRERSAARGQVMAAVRARGEGAVLELAQKGGPLGEFASQVLNAATTPRTNRTVIQVIDELISKRE